MKHLVIQMGTGEYAPILAEVAEYHAERFAAAGVAWRGMFQQVEPGEWTTREKLLMWRQACSELPDGARIAGADVDGLHVGDKVFPDGDWMLAGVRNNAGIINAGNLFLRNCKEIRDLLDETISNSRIAHPDYSGKWTEQRVLHWTLGNHRGVKRQYLGREWNDFTNAQPGYTGPIQWLFFHNEKHTAAIKLNLVKDALSMVKQGLKRIGGGWQ